MVRRNLGRKARLPWPKKGLESKFDGAWVQVLPNGLLPLQGAYKIY